MCPLRDRTNEKAYLAGVDASRRVDLPVLMDQAQILEKAEMNAAGISSLKERLMMDTSEEQIVRTLNELESLGELPLEIMRETMIGKTVNRLRKETDSDVVRKKSRALLSMWKCQIVHVAHAVINGQETPMAKRTRLCEDGAEELMTTPVKAAPVVGGTKKCKARRIHGNATTCNKENAAPLENCA
jgi:hypothetical protein